MVLPFVYRQQITGLMETITKDRYQTNFNTHVTHIHSKEMYTSHITVSQLITYLVHVRKYIYYMKIRRELKLYQIFGEFGPSIF